MPSMTPIPYRGWLIVPRQMSEGGWGVYWHRKKMGENYNFGSFLSEDAAVSFGKKAVDREIERTS